MNLNLNSTPSPFPIHRQIGTDNIDWPFGSINSSSSSSSPVSCSVLFNSTQDHSMGCYRDDQTELFRAQHIADDNQGKYNHVGSKYEIKNNRVDPSGFKLTLWKNEDLEERDNNHPVKWMSSKIRLMHKIKNNPGRVTPKRPKNKLENETSSFESDDSSGNGSSYTTNNGPVRVCSDCNTTKTPLWRSGPKGPKSLCNACGIRQRKARRAMAAAAAAASEHQTRMPMKIKAQQDKEKNVNFRKRCKTSTSEAGSQSDGRKKIGFEDFLINLSKNLSFQHVFPEDEKDAAILLMALSSGLVHG